MAPEVLMNMPYTIKADIYSYGIVLWEIITRTPPYQNMSGPVIIYKVCNNHERPSMAIIPPDCPIQVSSFILKVLLA